ncbi:uncharacterized protein LOC108956138 [Eucalyptus grandis]|uniref:uncharacterized protein LOC108956138 n=1 Tax=Eucalyptus grandis TaxID=71139 RepID=UPI00192E7C67|nr:uncharacterized protein LOC108956138 [Eucalyptus grandis]
MGNALRSMNIYRVLLLTLILVLAMTCSVESKQQCFTSSCGNIHNISYPFRLKTDPKGCGEMGFELICEDNQVVSYADDGRYYVQSINYSTRQVRLVNDGLQKDNCSSFPRSSLLLSSYFNQSALVIVNCSKTISSPFYIATGPCTEGLYSSNTSSNWNLYALVNPKVSDVGDFCNIYNWTWTDYFGVGEHINSSSYNYKLIHSIMADGFVIHFRMPPKKNFFCYFDWYGYFHLYRHFYSNRLANSDIGGLVCRSIYYYGSKY